jgi:hypothetical protein
MEEKKFVTDEMQIDTKAEDIIRSIEAKILKDTLDNFADKDDEIEGLKKFIDRINILETIYTKEQKDINENKSELMKEGAKELSVTSALADLIKITSDLDEYRRMLIAIEDDISKYAYKRLKDEKNQVEQIKDIAKEMHDAYNDYIKNNEKVIELLNQIRVSLSMSRAV